jgi:hypothetical protein
LFYIKPTTASGLNQMFDSGLEVFPNPSQAPGITFLANNSTQLLNIDCYNNAGCKIDAIALNHVSQFNYDKQLTPGVYVFKVTTNKGLINKRVVVD